MTETQRKAFCRNIKHLLVDTDVTQREIASAAGVSEQFLSAVLAGKKKPSLDIAMTIANKLGVTIDDLVRVQ